MNHLVMFKSIYLLKIICLKTLDLCLGFFPNFTTKRDPQAIFSIHVKKILRCFFGYGCLM